MAGCGGHGYPDLSFLEGLTELETLRMGDNIINDISVLAGLEKLEFVDISGNCIRDMVPLKHVPKVQGEDSQRGNCA